EVRGAFGAGAGVHRAGLELGRQPPTAGSQALDARGCLHGCREVLGPFLQRRRGHPGMNGFLALTWNGFREARRNKVTVVIAAFAAVVLMSTPLVMEITVTTFDRVLTDSGHGVMSLILPFLAICLCGSPPSTA